MSFIIELPPWLPNTDITSEHFCLSTLPLITPRPLPYVVNVGVVNPGVYVSLQQTLQKP